jgi:predicted secreted Zn-dependent protease
VQLVKSGSNQNRSYDALTSWYVYWNCQWEKSDNYCTITSVTTSVHVIFTLPEWIDYDSGKGKLKKRWDKYYRALIDHENGHQDNGIKAAKEIEKSDLEIEHQKKL